METENGVDRVKRMMAGFADIVVACLFYLVLDWVLPRSVARLTVLAFFLFRDAIPIGDLRGGSPGKRLMGLATVRRNGNFCDLKTSAKRNITLVIGPIGYVSVSWVFGSILFWGWMAQLTAIILTGLMLVVEGLEAWSNPRGRRVGDMVAGTKVIETDRGNHAGQGNR